MKAITVLFAAFLILTSFVPQPISTSDVGMINWMTWEDAMEAQKITPRKIFIDVYTDWCGYCKKMDQTTFQNRDIIRALSDEFYAIKLDAERKDVIEYNGEVYRFVDTGKRSAHQLAHKLLDDRMSYPSFVYLDEELNKIMASSGYKKSAQLLHELRFIESVIYKEMSWQEYSQRAE